MSSDAPAQLSPWREKIHEIIFEADTPLGKLFDVTLLIVIAASVLAVSLESVDSIQDDIGPWLRVAEWVFTGLFTVEYVLRLICVRSPLRYARSFFGVVDVLAILPSYLSLVFPGSQSLLVIRALRLLRVFRVFKLARYLGEANILLSALRESRNKILVFITGVLIIVVIVGSLMYLIEGEEAGFDSIPRGVYWAIVTVTTVGYGDIAPLTVPGQVVASALMIVGYGVLAVPTGIFSMEIVQAVQRAQIKKVTTRACKNCSAEGHDQDAKYCKFCGVAL
jgi:voltage-gated potassium channel